MNLLELMVKIGADDSEFQAKASGVKQAASRLASGLKTGLAVAGKAAAAGVAAASGALVVLGKQALEGYASYEQLAGGVETLFGTSKDVVMDYANAAYKNAGMSANRYMETVTGFSASLLQGLGGDTAKAAKYANTALEDMSDNANKMGTDMEAITSAYQGFAKQNYTMLDNLKLGRTRHCRAEKPRENGETLALCA